MVLADSCSPVYRLLYSVPHILDVFVPGSAKGFLNLLSIEFSLFAETLQ